MCPRITGLRCSMRTIGVSLPPSIRPPPLGGFKGVTDGGSNDKRLCFIFGGFFVDFVDFFGFDLGFDFFIAPLDFLVLGFDLGFLGAFALGGAMVNDCRESERV